MGITIGRAIFVSVPFILTLVALAGSLLAFTGNISTSSIAQSYYWLSVTSTPTGGVATRQTLGLWNSCVRTAGATTCTSPQAAYFFDPMTGFNISSIDLASLDVQWPAAFVDAMDMFRSMTKGAFYIYAAGIILALATLPVSFFAFASRAGSLIAVAVNFATGLCFLVGSTLYTVVFASLNNFIKHAVIESSASDEGITITSSLNGSTLAATWLAVLAITIAWWFWAITCCCCKGRVRRSDSYKLVDRETPMLGAHQVHGYGGQEYGVRPVSVSSTRYEPYRS